MTVASRIGQKTVVVGNVHGDGDLDVHGRVEGDITVSGSVLVHATSEIKGSISAAAIKVAGTVEGNLVAQETVTIEPEARVVGDMTTPRVAIAEGALVRGMLRTEGNQRSKRVGEASAAAFRTPGVMPPQSAERSATAAAAPKFEASKFEVERAPSHGQQDFPDVTTGSSKKHKGRKDKRPPEPKMPLLAKGTKGKKKGDRRAHDR